MFVSLGEQILALKDKTQKTSSAQWLLVDFANWKFLTAIIIGTMTTLLAPNDFFDDASSDLVTIFGIIMAALVPAMILAATSMRAGGFSVGSVRLLAEALDKQIALFSRLFLYALVGAILIVVAKSVDWSLPSFPIKLGQPPELSPSRLWNFLIASLVSFLVLRLFDAMKNIRGILDLSSDIAVGEAFERSKMRSQNANAATRSAEID